MTEKKPEKSEYSKKMEHLMFNKHYLITFRVIAITIVSIAIFAGIGYLLDQIFQTYPLFLIIGVVSAYPLSQIFTYKVFKKITKKD
ncbi:hypothetical protein GF376_04075 [Candidatus Peregrinibacteria bacterium]|nr:hypothetical protein [Candidatus Peregrinibacteria bacterium]